MAALAGIGLAEDDWIPISALEHFSYCPRQYALIHIEQVFDENLYTQRGRFVHERVDLGGTLGVADRVELGLPLFSRHLGLTGKADLVEFHRGVPYPVEYKYGRDIGAGHDELQVCAQAICLEEMLGVGVPVAAVFRSGRVALDSHSGFLGDEPLLMQLLVAGVV